jgi:folate-binding protein YgfZ
MPLYAGLLSPQGKALFDMLLFVDPADDSILVDVARNRAESLAKRLTLYKMRKAVTITATDLAVFASWDEASTHPVDPRFAPLGSRWIAPADGPDGAAAYHAHRIATGVPDSTDIGEDALLWLETGADLLNGVSFTKGCYVGQENTARMHHRDKVRRRLVPVSFAGDPGDGTVRDGAGRSAGSLRSPHFAHLRLETAAEPLFVGTAPVTIHTPAWLAPAFAA